MEIYEKLKEKGLDLPINIGDVLGGFNFELVFEDRKRIANKDIKRIQGFLPAVYEKVAHMSFEIGIRVGQSDGPIPETTIELSEELKTFFKETEAVLKMWEDQLRGFRKGDIFGDPTKLERLVTRIYAKRNGLNKAYLDILGVDDNHETPTEYPEEFKQWLD